MEGDSEDNLKTQKLIKELNGVLSEEELSKKLNIEEKVFEGVEKFTIFLITTVDGKQHKCKQIF
jgi:hypothetical protein